MAKNNIWMSVSDLMTGLMVIFLFVAIAYINKVQEHSVTLKDYVEVKENLHDKLVSKFEGESIGAGQEYIQLKRSIRSGLERHGLAEGELGAR